MDIREPGALRGSFRAGFSCLLVILMAVPSFLAAATPSEEAPDAGPRKRETDIAQMPAGWYIDEVNVIVDTLHTILKEGFETGGPNWTHNGTFDDWQIGAPGGSKGPDSAYQGQNCTATNLTGPYGQLADCYLESPDFNLSMAFSAQMSYYEWYDVAPQDSLYVSLVANWYGNSFESDGIEINGSSGQWTQRTIDLAQFMKDGKQFACVGSERVHLKFRLVSRASLWLAAHAGNKYVQLNWMPAMPPPQPSVTGYDIYRGPSSGSLTKLKSAVNVTGYNDTAVFNGDTYYYCVGEVLSTGGEGNRSNTVNATPLALPGPPRNPAVKAGIGFLNLSWQPPADDGGYNITGYWLYRGVGTRHVAKVLKLGDVQAFKDTNVTNGTVYYYAFSAVNSMGEGGKSSVVNGSPAIRPSPPTNLMAWGEGFIIHLSWEAPADVNECRVTGYAIHRWNGTGPWSTVLTCCATAQDDWLSQSETQVFYAVSSLNDFGESDPCSAVSILRPTAPRDLKVTYGPEGMRLDWTEPWNAGGCGIATYYVYHSVNGSAWEFLVSTPDNRTGWTDVGQDFDSTISYRISALNAVGESDPCTAQSVTQDTTLPEIVIEHPLTGVFLNSTTLVVSGRANDPVGIRSVMITGPNGWVMCNGTLNWQAEVTLGEGRRTVQVRATDMANNVKTASIELTIDLAAPKLAFTYPADGSVVASSVVNFSGQVQDASPIESVELSTDGLFWFRARGNDSWICPLPLRNGPNRVYLRASDIVGNSDATSINVVLDSGPPSLIISSPRPSQHFSSARELKVEGRAWDDTGVARVEISLDGKIWTVADGNDSWSSTVSVGPGLHRIQTRATDLAGRVILSEVTINIERGPSSSTGTAPPLLLAAAILVIVAAVVIVVVLRRKKNGGTGEPVSRESGGQSGEPVIR